ncbi:hypothetical protein ABIC22_000009 [Paenibacillus sp. PvP094]|uniref:hypothetical protein n=1 Tax=Paenibacillus sp. PvP094 TaxID=3156394 RepID=UPI003390CC41
MAKEMRLVCVVCSNEQTGWTNQDGTACTKCGGYAQPVGYYDGRGSYISHSHKSPNEHNITIDIQGNLTQRDTDEITKRIAAEVAKNLFDKG